MMWVDKHRPTSLDRLDYHKEQAAQLRQLAQAGDLPHMLFYGPSGAGKKTRIMCLLREIFGAGVERVKLEHRPFKVPSGKVRWGGGGDGDGGGGGGRLRAVSRCPSQHRCRVLHFISPTYPSAPRCAGGGDDHRGVGAPH